MSEPFGEIVTAGKSERSDAGAAFTGCVHRLPSSVPSVTSACSFGPPLVSVGVGPLHQVSTIVFDAPLPLGAPLAIPNEGEVPVRAPPTPSKERRPIFASNAPHGVKVAITCGRSNDLPPSK